MGLLEVGLLEDLQFNMKLAIYNLPFSSSAYNSPSFAIYGKTSFSIDVGTGCEKWLLL